MIHRAPHRHVAAAQLGSLLALVALFAVGCNACALEVDQSIVQAGAFSGLAALDTPGGTRLAALRQAAGQKREPPRSGACSERCARAYEASAAPHRFSP